MRPKILREIKEAKKNGLAWTTPRPFLDLKEKLGAFRCGIGNVTHRHRKGRDAKYVSYSTEIAGRVVYCEACYNLFGKIPEKVSK